MSSWHQTPRGKWWMKCYNAALRANLRAIKYNVPERLTPEDIDAVLKDANCFYCGKAQQDNPCRRDMIGIDHRIPLSMGGPNTRSNIVASCHSCNVSKAQANEPWRWSQHFDACVVCGTTDRPHDGKGKCHNCASRERSRAKGAKARTIIPTSRRIRVEQ